MTRTHAEFELEVRRGVQSNGRSVVELIKDLRDETTRLLRQEVALAKAEMAQKGKVYGRNAAFLVIGGAVAYLGLLFLLTAGMLGIYLGLMAADVPVGVRSWLAPLIVGVVVCAIGYALIQKGISTIKREPAMPEKTLESIQENTTWLKHKLT